MKFDRKKIVIWQLMFLLLSTTWLWAPSINHILSYRTSLISQYETVSQPFALLFRLGDIAGAIFLSFMAIILVKRKQTKTFGKVLLIIAAGMAVDALVPTTCRMELGLCREFVSPSSIVHAIESVLTSICVFGLAFYDSWKRKRLSSVAFVIFQLLYGLLFITQFATLQHFNTLSQFTYQLTVLVWLSWLCRELIEPVPRLRRSIPHIKEVVALWAALSGALSIITSLGHIHLFGRVRGLYFTGDTAWLAQHGIIVGIVMLYLSRHLSRGEIRARQIFLYITALEILKYSVLTPHPLLLFLYVITFCALLVIRSSFDRGIETMTFSVRIKDATYLLITLLCTATIGLLLLHRDSRLSTISNRAVSHIIDYTFRSNVITRSQMKSAVLAHTMSTFVFMGIGTILWVLFRPYKHTVTDEHDQQRIRKLLQKYAQSPDDYFKTWPSDKQYFWSKDGEGFIAYKIEGPIAFAVADPIAQPAKQSKLVSEYISWCRSSRLRACFMPVFSQNLDVYKRSDLKTMQIGSSALITTRTFLNSTVRDKWWRWQLNRAAKSNYQYAKSTPPHTQEFLNQCRRVSDDWLRIDAHEERGFLLGYFDDNYLQSCTIHYLTDDSGMMVAFVNELPKLRSLDITSIDLLRHTAEADNAMTFLLSKTIESAAQEGYTYFDLGFVPFAGSEGPILTIVRALSGGRFSSKGLEQFKNKFRPEWQRNYIAYDGDLADLALIAANIEKVMRVE